MTTPSSGIIGGREAIQIDITLSPEAQDCPELGAPLVLTGDDEPAWRDVRLSDGERMRLYLLDLPESTTIKVLAIAIVAPEATFDDVVAAAARILGSIAIHAQS